LNEKQYFWTGIHTAESLDTDIRMRKKDIVEPLLEIQNLLGNISLFYEFFSKLFE